MIYRARSFDLTVYQPYLKRVLRVTNSSQEARMRSFIVAWVAAIVIAAFGTVTLDLVQEPVSVAFATKSVRI